MCGLDIGGSDTKTPHFVSITHLSFDRRMPLFRRIATYQHHRIKKAQKAARSQRLTSRPNVVARREQAGFRGRGVAAKVRRWAQGHRIC